MASLCQSQQRCVKASIACQWQLAEAQDQLCGLELHGSESVEQEHARALASSTELSQIEQEWRHKERMLGRSPRLCPEASRDVFDKVVFGMSSGPLELILAIARAVTFVVTVWLKIVTLYDH